MNAALVRILGGVGFAGACVMFWGDMQFYGHWGSGRDALTNTVDIVAQTEPRRLMFGGLASLAGGFCYAVAALHVYARLARHPSWLRLVIAACFLAVAIIATATHAVWGSFALSISADASSAASLSRYLSLHFLVGGVIGVPATVLLAFAILSGRSDWPRWFVTASPGPIYLLLSTATYLPAPLGAPVVGGGFNLAFAVFYGVSVIQSFQWSRREDDERRPSA